MIKLDKVFTVCLGLDFFPKYQTDQPACRSGLQQGVGGGLSLYQYSDLEIPTPASLSCNPEGKLLWAEIFSGLLQSSVGFEKPVLKPELQNCLLKWRPVFTAIFQHHLLQNIPHYEVVREVGRA